MFKVVMRRYTASAMISKSSMESSVSATPKSDTSKNAFRPKNGHVHSLFEATSQTLRRPSKIHNATSSTIPSKNEYIYGKTINPIHAFENAIKIGSPLDINNTLISLRKANKLNDIDILTLNKLVYRVAQGQFGFLGGSAGYGYVKRISDEYFVDGKINLEFDVGLIKCFQNASLEGVRSFVSDFKNILQKYKSDGDRLAILLAFFDVLRHHQLIEACEELFGRLAKLNVDMTLVFLNMAQAYSSSGQVEKAEELFDDLRAKGLTTPSAHLVSLANGYAKKGKINKVRKYVDMLNNEEYAQVQGISAILRCFAELQLPGESTKAYRKFRESGHPSTAYMMQNLITSTKVLIESTLATKWFYKLESTKIKPSMGMYGALIDVVLQTDSLTAYRLLRSSIESFQSERTRSSRIHIPLSIALPLAKDLSNKHVDYLRGRMTIAMIKTSMRSPILTQLMAASIILNDYKLTMVLYNEFKDGCGAGCDVTTLAHIHAMVASAHLQDIETFESIYTLNLPSFKRNEDRGTDVLMACYSIVGNTAKVREVYDSAMKAGFTASAATYEVLVGGYKEEDGDVEVDGYVDEVCRSGIIVSQAGQPRLFEAMKSRDRKLLSFLEDI